MKREFQGLIDGSTRTVVTLSEADIRGSEPKYLWERLVLNGSVIQTKVWIVAPGAEQEAHMTFEQLLRFYPPVSDIVEELQRILEAGDPNCLVRVVFEPNDIIVTLPPRVNQACYRFIFALYGTCIVYQPDVFYDDPEDSDSKWVAALDGTWDEGLALLSEALKGTELSK